MAFECRRHCDRSIARSARRTKRTSVRATAVPTRPILAVCFASLEAFTARHTTLRRATFGCTRACGGVVDLHASACASQLHSVYGTTVSALPTHAHAIHSCDPPHCAHSGPSGSIVRPRLAQWESPTLQPTTVGIAVDCAPGHARTVELALGESAAKPLGFEIVSICTAAKVSQRSTAAARTDAPE